MLIELLLISQLNQLNTNLIAEYNMESNLPHLRKIDNSYPSGLEYKDDGHVKYGPPSIDDPILFIVDAIFDRDMNYIPPGYYQLTLDPGRQYMYLVQSGKILAHIPVFKIEIDRKAEIQKIKNQPPKNFFKRQIFKLKRKIKKHRHDQNVKKKRIEDSQQIYSEATMELVAGEKYYLIMYEKGSVRAWGALKFR